MNREHWFSRLASLWLAIWMLLVPVAGVAQTPAAADSAAAKPPVAVGTLDEARELIKNGEYDPAIEILKTTIAREKSRIELTREAYLLLIKTYVFQGNSYRLRPQGREISNLNYRMARELIAEALGIKALRHLRPEPEADYPPEMITLFREVRSQILGSFRVASLEPREALVTFDGDTLRSFPGDSLGLPGDVDLAVGNHLVVVRADGYQDQTEEVQISSGGTLERSYTLPKRRGPMWYATRGGGALAGVVGVIALIAGKGGGGGTTPPPEPLPGAPPPPTR